MYDADPSHHERRPVEQQSKAQAVVAAQASRPSQRHQRAARSSVLASTSASVAQHGQTFTLRISAAFTAKSARAAPHVCHCPCRATRHRTDPLVQARIRWSPRDAVESWRSCTGSGGEESSAAWYGVNMSALCGAAIVRSTTATARVQISGYFVRACGLRGGGWWASADAGGVGWTDPMR